MNAHVIMTIILHHNVLHSLLALHVGSIQILLGGIIIAGCGTRHNHNELGTVFRYNCAHTIIDLGEEFVDVLAELLVFAAAPDEADKSHDGVEEGAREPEDKSADARWDRARMRDDEGSVVDGEEELMMSASVPF